MLYCVYFHNHQACVKISFAAKQSDKNDNSRNTEATSQVLPSFFCAISGKEKIYTYIPLRHLPVPEDPDDSGVESLTQFKSKREGRKVLLWRSSASVGPDGSLPPLSPSLQEFLAGNDTSAQVLYLYCNQGKI